MLLLITPDTTTLSCWLNWRVFLCAVWILTPLMIAVFIIWKYDGLDHLRSSEGKTQQEAAHLLYGDESWRPCLKEIHPIWLLIYRIASFCLLSATIIFRVSVTGFGIFYFYTQWTFTLLTVYFGFGLLLSLRGCHQYHKFGCTPFDLHHIGRDAEQGHYVPLRGRESASVLETRGPSSPQNEIYAIQAASITSYVFQNMFQVVAGAVMLTDCVYWFIIFPYFTIKDCALHFVSTTLLDWPWNCLLFILLLAVLYHSSCCL
uniref:Uncharacterized protein MANES_15G166900 n=1 Tax=Rhizophora mucronata TaxID=61149 RepID=A0A2P2KFA4_RHIMU